MNQDIIALNKKRVQIRAKEVIDQIHEQDSAIIKQCDFFYEGKKINSKDIDFKKSCIFITDHDFLGIIGYLGLININNIHIPDTTQAGTYSTIRTDFMTVNSPDIRFSKIEINEGYGYEEIDMPESYKPINFMKKQLILWRLELDVGIGDSRKMYRLCNQWIKDRFATNKLDWLFFVGTEEQFIKSYGNDLNLPIYTVELRSAMPNIKDIKGRIVPGDAKYNQLESTITLNQVQSKPVTYSK